MTPWQCEKIVAAQARRVDRVRKDQPGGGPAAPPAFDRAGGPPVSRAALVTDLMELGHGRAAAEAIADRQFAAWEATRGDPA